MIDLKDINHQPTMMEIEEYIGNDVFKEQDEFDKLFPTLSKEIQEIYNTTKEGNSQRWLMIDIKNSDCVYDDVLKLIKIRRESK